MLLCDAFVHLPAALQALIATLFTWGVTALGAAIVFFAKDVSLKALDTMLGFAAGVMIAASFWSLLAPAIEFAADGPVPAWLPAVAGFLAGGAFLVGVDELLPHLHLGGADSEPEGLKTKWRRAVLLVLAITLHNIPEGMAVGVGFGAVAVGIGDASIWGPIALVIGIGLRNFPEGAAVSLPLRSEGLSRWKSFSYGQLSAAVEPVAGVLGALAVVMVQPLLPYALGFAAGAMIFVVAEDLIPEAHRHGHRDLAAIGVMLGFAVMMTLDVALG